MSVPSYQAGGRFYVPLCQEPAPLLELVAGPSHHQGTAVSVYGCLCALAPSGRPNDTAAPTRKELEALVRHCSRNGVATTYLLNGLGCGLDTWPDDLLRWLRDSLRPSAVCLTELGLARNLISIWPEVSIEISTIAGCLEFNHAEAFLSDPLVGPRVRALCLHHDATSHNWQRTAEFGAWLIGRNVDPFVLVNESCMVSCPVRESHYRLFGSRARMRHTKDFLDPFQVGCVLARLMEPWTLLDLAGFLQPSLLAEFTARTGIRGFKLAGRSMPWEWVASAFHHYANAKDPANLFDLVVFTTPFLERWRMTSADLFHLDSSAYRHIHEALATMPSASRRRAFLKTEAIRLHHAGQLRVCDPGSEYAVRDGALVQVKPGEYSSFLQSLRLKGSHTGPRPG